MDPAGRLSRGGPGTIKTIDGALYINLGDRIRMIDPHPDDRIEILGTDFPRRIEVPIPRAR